MVIKANSRRKHLSDKELTKIEEHNLKNLMVHSLPVLQTAIEEVIKWLSKEDLCKWLCSLQGSISSEVFDELVEEAESWEIIREEYIAGPGGADNILDETAIKPQLTMINGGK
jgi:uncharacterized Zn finger protein